VRATWLHRPALVEWDLTGDASDGFGAIVYRVAAPALIIREFAATHPTEAAVAAAIDRWLAEVAERYRVDRRFQEFKALARTAEATQRANEDGRNGA
jgi:hypothetical protein